MAEELPLPPLPRASPKVPRPIDDEPKTDPHIRTHRRSTRALIALAGTIATAVGGFAAKRAQDADDNVAIQAATTKQQLDDHIAKEAEHHTDVKRQLEQLDKGQRRTDRSTATIKAMLDLELDQHHVPRERRPTEQDFETAEP